MIRQAAIAVAVISAAMVLALYFWRIEPFLPARGGTTCFAADYDPPRPLDLSSPRRDERSTGGVGSMRMAIYFPPDEEPFRSNLGGYDWRYTLRLDTRFANSERLQGAATCEWSEGFIGTITPSLSCYIDCDGGGVTVWRRIGTNTLSVRFEAGERLRMGESCDGSGARVFIGAENEARDLPVRPAPCESRPQGTRSAIE